MTKRMMVSMAAALLLNPGVVLAADDQVPLDEVHAVPAEDSADMADDSSPEEATNSLGEPASGQSLDRGDGPRIGDDESGMSRDAGRRME